MPSISLDHPVLARAPASLHSAASPASDMAAGRHQWFILRVRPRHEKSVSTTLQNLGYNTFLPLFVKRRTLGQRETRLPLFPGYVFWFCDPSRSASPPRLASVLECLHSNGEPSAVSNEEIHAIQTVAEKRIELEPCSYPQTGDTVRIVRGPLAGVTGKVIEAKDKSIRLVLSIETLQRSVTLEIDRTLVQTP